LAIGELIFFCQGSDVLADCLLAALFTGLAVLLFTVLLTVADVAFLVVSPELYVGTDFLGYTVVFRLSLRN
jgi:hypothetical protein